MITVHFQGEDVPYDFSLEMPAVPRHHDVVAIDSRTFSVQFIRWTVSTDDGVPTYVTLVLAPLR